MTAATGLAAAAADLQELAPVLRRAVTLDPASLVRIIMATPTVSALVRLPFGVLVSRTVEMRGDGAGEVDTTLAAADLLAWLDGERADPPEPRDAEWRSGVPPTSGWRRVDTVPDDVVRGLVRSGALVLEQAAAREGLAQAQPRAEVADALLDSVVLTVEQHDLTVGLSLRSVSALTRMGFLPRGSHMVVDVAGRWTRLAAAYGSVYSERPGLGLGVIRR